MSSETHYRRSIGLLQRVGLERMRKIADEVGAILWIDMAHTAVLLLRVFEESCQICSYRNIYYPQILRGPRGGIILMGKDF